ncbi:GtrA family protein [Marinobacter caseinilyticus]|uniref:GtrA family protein n=1 Tax=Marinobacter caseinilyticus TaxID=2692195 RepID=UPI001409DEA9|nr:GtrA family protein [Marinobacter caseinilyticus]
MSEIARRRQPFRFVVSGGLATGMHWLAMSVMILFGAEPAWATAAGSVVGAGANYALQRQLTFRSRKAHRRTLPRYLLSCVIAWTTNLLLFYALYQDAGLQPVSAQLITTVVVAALNYSVFKRLVFND